MGTVPLPPLTSTLLAMQAPGLGRRALGVGRRKITSTARTTMGLALRYHGLRLTGAALAMVDDRQHWPRAA